MSVRLVFSNISIHGVRVFAKSELSKVEKVVWGGTVVLALILMCASFVSFVVLVKQYPSTVAVQVSKERMTFPAVTACNLGKYKKSVVSTVPTFANMASALSAINTQSTVAGRKKRDSRGSIMRTSEKLNVPSALEGTLSKRRNSEETVDGQPHGHIIAKRQIFALLRKHIEAIMDAQIYWGDLFVNYVGYKRATVTSNFLSDYDGSALPSGSTFVVNDATNLCLLIDSYGKFTTFPCSDQNVMNATRDVAFCSCSLRCPNCAIPTDTIVQNLNYSINSIVNFACPPGYYMTGSSSIICNASAYGQIRWSSAPPTCTQSACPPLVLTNQIANTTNSNLTNQMGFSCPTGFVLVGLTVIICVPNGSHAVWSSNPPLCAVATTTPSTSTSTTSAKVSSTIITVALTATKISMTLSCSFLVIAIGLIIAVTFLIRDFSIETCLHLNQEFALFFAHLHLLIFRDRTDLTNVCPAASGAIQYFFTTASLCMMIEAVHSHAILQNVISFGGMINYPRLKYSIVGWLVPILPTAVTIAMHYDKYPSTYGCYVNLGDQIALFIMGPIIACFIVTIVLTEAAAMGDWMPLPLSSKFQRLAAHVNQKAMTPLALLSFGSWFLGLWASYLNSPYVFSFGSGINMAFGVSVVVFHFIGNPKLNNWLHQTVLKHLCNKQQNP